MRFHQLRPGARFRYKETIYRKISPLRGAGEADETQKLIPRSAEVTLLDEQGQAAPAKLPQSLNSSQLEAELKRLSAACDQAALRLDPPLTESQRTALQHAISSASEDLLTRLALATESTSITAPGSNPDQI